MNNLKKYEKPIVIEEKISLEDVIMDIAATSGGLGNKVYDNEDDYPLG